MSEAKKLVQALHSAAFHEGTLEHRTSVSNATLRRANNAMLRARREIERLRNGLHRISLASQNSMSSKEECGRIARETLAGKKV